MSTDYAITTETLVTVHLTESQARAFIDSENGAVLSLQLALMDALRIEQPDKSAQPAPAAPRKPGQALTVKRQPRQAKAKPAAAAPAKKAKARLTCAHCNSQFSSQAFLARHLLRMHQDAPVAASAADE